MVSANWTWQTGEESPSRVPWDAGLLFNIPRSPPPLLSKGQFTALHCYKTQAAFLKQDVCLRPPSPQINNPQNLISGGRVEALESHYFHIPYPGAFGLLRECGRPGAGKAQGCGRNLRPCARFHGRWVRFISLRGLQDEGRGFKTYRRSGSWLRPYLSLRATLFKSC